MKLIKQSHEILYYNPKAIEIIERCARTCYKSEDKITENSAKKFVQMLLDKKHHAMIEFSDIIVKFITNRGVSHELVRHRLCSFAQESTRYVNYNSSDMEFIKPVWLHESYEDEKQMQQNVNEIKAKWQWAAVMSKAEQAYNELINFGWRPEQAREILPNSIKTEIIIKANIREWRHILTLRTSKQSHPQMRALMIPLVKELQSLIPIVFDDIKGETK